MKKNDLFAAAYNNDVAAVKAAIAAGQNPNAQSPKAGTLPLQLACQGDAIEAIAALLSAGANADAVFTRVSRVDGRRFGNHTPLMYAESVDAARMLLDAGAEIDRQDDKGWTALVCAAHAGNNGLAAYLLDRGARTDVRLSHAGRQMNVLEFLDEEVKWLRGNAESLKQPAASQRIAALEVVRETVANRKRT